LKAFDCDIVATADCNSVFVVTAPY